MYCCLSFCNSFPREACNNLAQPMKINTLEKNIGRIIFQQVPKPRNSASMCYMSVSVSTQGGSSNQELSPQAARCVAQEFLMSLFPGCFPNDCLEVRQSGKRLVAVLVTVTDPFQNAAKDWMFGHPTRDSLDSVATTCRFLRHESYHNMITRYGPLSEVVRYMETVLKITRLCHRYKHERSVDSGWCAKRTISGGHRNHGDRETQLKQRKEHADAETTFVNNLLTFPDTSIETNTVTTTTDTKYSVSQTVCRLAHFHSRISFGPFLSMSTLAL